VPNILAAMQNGSLDAGVLSPPIHWRAEKLGFKEIVSITDLNIAYPNPAITVGKKTIKEKEDALKKFMRGYSRGLERLRADKPFSKKVLVKYTQIQDDELIDKVYDLYVHKVLEPVARISQEALRGAVEEQALGNAKIREMPLGAFYDDRFVR
jgi:ABC-type nitrate/sulfonate/bicarbonate transport system substrate-binding protein